MTAQIEVYRTKRFDRYVSWYVENAKIARTNLLVAFGVVVICALCLLYFPGPLDEMSLFQYSFDPTNAVKVGLVASILLALVSMFTSFRQRMRCLDMEARLQAELRAFDEASGEASGDGHDADREAEFQGFQDRVEALMAASNPALVTAIEHDNATRNR